MGGILARVYLAKTRPAKLGRVVAERGQRAGGPAAPVRDFRAFYGPAGSQLSTQLDATLRALQAIDYPLGIIAGSRTIDPMSSRFVLPKPSDAKVSVASTRLAGMVDHVVMPASHPMLVLKTPTIAQTIAFLRHGRFDR